MKISSNLRRAVAAMCLAAPTIGAPSLAETQPDSPAAAVDVKPTESPFLWKIALDPPSYLYGTIHLPDARVLALPDVVTRAFQASDIVYLEVPMDAAAQQEAASAFLLPEGKSLRAMLPAKLYERADAYCSSKGIPLAMLDRLSIMGVVVQLQLLDYTDELMAGHMPLDVSLSRMAAAEEKPVRHLETIQEQITALTGFTEEEQISLLEQTLDLNDRSAAKGTTPTEDLVTAYLSGKESELLRLTEESFDPAEASTQKFMKNLVDDRNERMADRIAERLRAEPGQAHFFAVGTLHYPAATGILARLDAKGFEIERLAPADIADIPLREPAGALAE